MINTEHILGKIDVFALRNVTTIQYKHGYWYQSKVDSLYLYTSILMYKHIMCHLRNKTHIFVFAAE